MPLKRGKSRATERANFHELRHGKQFGKTAAKFGKRRAEKQMVAIVLKEAGEGRPRTHAKSHRKTGFGRGSV